MIDVLKGSGVFVAVPLGKPEDRTRVHGELNLEWVADASPQTGDVAPTCGYPVGEEPTERVESLTAEELDAILTDPAVEADGLAAELRKIPADKRGSILPSMEASRPRGAAEADNVALQVTVVYGQPITVPGEKPKHYLRPFAEGDSDRENALRALQLHLSTQ